MTPYEQYNEIQSLIYQLEEKGRTKEEQDLIVEKLKILGVTISEE